MRYIYKFFSLDFWKVTFLYPQALYFFSKRDFQKSIEKFKKTFILEVDNPHLTYNCYKYIGISYCYLNEISEGKRYLEKALSLNKINKHDAELYAYLGHVYDNEADLVRAKECYQLAQQYEKRSDFLDRESIKERLEKINQALEA